MIQLRYYQQEALDAIYKYYSEGNTGNCLVGLPTGTGKSILPAAFIQGVMKQWPNTRFLMITHVKELISQNANELLELWPEAPLGIYSSGLKLKQTAQPIIFGGVQSMIKHPQLFGHRDIAFVDEAHLVSAEESSQYQTFFAFMKLINPNLKIIGMSATLYRMGMGMITENGLFTDIVYDKTSLEGFNELLAAGYMAPLIPLRTKTELDVSDVSIQKGEFAATQLQGAVDKAPITFKALQELVHAGQNRKSWLIFASGIEHAEHIAEQLGAFGIDCAPVHSKRPIDYNDAAIKAFKSNELRAIVNYGKLTTGFNHPEIDLIGMLRPTLSVPLWVQMLGRGTRPANGKENCIAKGSLILTNNGLIPIEKISINDKIWDGETYVFHSGVICQGYKEVIEYNGLVATMDHKVATREGWQTFGKCSKERIAIKVTGNGRKPIRETENLFRANNTEKTFIHRNTMHKMLSNSIQRIYQRYKLQSWLSSLWQLSCLASSAQMVAIQMHSGKRSLYKSEQPSLFRLWGERNKIQLFKSNSNGYLGNAKSWIRERVRDRSNRKQWTLRSWKFKIFNTNRKYEQSQNISQNTRSLSTRLVFDILNCGPNNRFTVNGLLVHNCLTLDFARNTPRLGPINDPQIPKMKKGEAGDMPVKICENCGAYNHTKVRFCCNCGEEFSFQMKLVSKPGTEELIRAAAVEQTPIIETFNVLGAHYEKHNAASGKPTLKVTYYTTGLPFKEFICLEHSGLAGKMARDWWRKRHKLEPPSTVDEALIHMAQLRCPRFIRVHVNKKYPEILSAEF